jgi:2-aminoadipate transaminase
LIEPRAGAGSDYRWPMAVTPESGRWEELFAARTRAGAGDGIAAILGLLANPELISFAGGFPDPATFPAERTAGLLAELAGAGDSLAFQYAPTHGLDGTRDALASRLETLQGARPAEDELLVTSGGIEALELVAKSFLDRGDTVVVEGPTYLGAIMAFRGFEADVVAVPLDDDGLDVDALAALLDGGVRPKLLYTIPDHQNPAGVTLALDRRVALVELARRHGFLLVEDVAYRELGFDGTALPSLWSIGQDVVVQAGTTSKTFFPGVRLGWAVGPAQIVAQLVSAKQNTDQCSGALGQRLFEEYARRGWIDEQLARSRALYERKGRRLLAALERTMPAGVTWTRPAGGFFSWLTLPTDAAELARRAAADGVAVVPGALFYPDGRGTTNVRLSYSMVDESLIDAGIERLAALVRL